VHYPRLEIRLEIIRKNVTTILEKCDKHSLMPTFVTKGFLADFPLLTTLYKGGVRRFADSNMINLLRMRAMFGKEVELFLIRLPMQEELELVCQNDIVPLISHWEVLEALHTTARKAKKRQRVMLAVEGGDAREGFLPEEFEGIEGRVRDLSWLSVEGIATTLACLSGVLPDRGVVKRLTTLKKELRQKLGKDHFILSVGGTTFFELWRENETWMDIDEIRFGEAFLFGSDISRKKTIEWLSQGAFLLYAEIVEVRSKKVTEEVERGFDAFGRSLSLFPSAPRRRALVALGKQDIDESQLYFWDGNVTIIGATSNYLVLDVEESDKGYKVGDIVCFYPGYGAVLRAFLSPYVEKVYVS